MTVPFGAAQPQRMPNGYVQLPGGYGDATQQAQGQQPPQLPPQMVQYPTQLGLPPQMQQQAPIMQDQNYTQAPQQQQSVNQYASQMRQVPQQGQFVSPQQQAGLQQQQQPQAVDLNQRVYGPNVPAELQGRTLQEILGITQGLRQIHLQSLSNQPQQQNQQPAQLNQQAPSNSTAGGQTAAWDWKNPTGSIEAVVDKKNGELLQKIEGMIAPATQQAASTAMTNARNQAALEIGPQTFAQIEPLVMQRLQGADPRVLTNPTIWRVTADSVIGELSRRGVLQPQQQQNGAPGAYPVQQTQGQPIPNLNSFYTEQPNQGGGGPQGVQLTQNEVAAAAAMGISLADYSAWKGGVPVNQAVIQQPMQYRMGRGY